MRVYHRAHALRLGFSTQRGELLVGERLRATVANARGREDLDDVGAFSFAPANLRAQRIGRRTGAAERIERSQNTRTGNSAGRNPFAQILVLRRARALNR